jgi:hypothetical protein
MKSGMSPPPKRYDFVSQYGPSDNGNINNNGAVALKLNGMWQGGIGNDIVPRNTSLTSVASLLNPDITNNTFLGQRHQPYVLDSQRRKGYFKNNKGDLKNLNTNHPILRKSRSPDLKSALASSVLSSATPKSSPPSRATPVYDTSPLNAVTPHFGSVNIEDEKPSPKVSHKLAERRRRKELRELYDSLRLKVPAVADHPKAPILDILSHATSYIVDLKAKQRVLEEDNAKLTELVQ